jgi:superfamily I DNA and/or RNA helicase
VDTVERFQGQEKAVMIASFGLGDVDQIAAEEAFLYSLNRFNVIASRAKAKLIVIMSRRLVDHLPRDRQALAESRLLKHLSLSRLNVKCRQNLEIRYYGANVVTSCFLECQKPGELKSR